MPPSIQKVFNFFRNKLRVEAEAMMPLFRQGARVEAGPEGEWNYLKSQKKIIRLMGTDAYTEKLGEELLKIAKHPKVIELVNELNTANKVCWQLKNGDGSGVEDLVRLVLKDANYWHYTRKQDLIDRLLSYKAPGGAPHIAQVKTKEFLADLFEKDNNQRAAIEMFLSAREDYRRLGMKEQMEKAYLDSERCADRIGESKEQRLFEATHPGQLCARKKQIAADEDAEHRWSIVR